MLKNFPQVLHSLSSVWIFWWYSRDFRVGKDFPQFLQVNGSEFSVALVEDVGDGFGGKSASSEKNT